MTFLNKVSAQPNIEWEKSYGGSENDNATFANQTSDGGFIISGISRSQNGDVSNNYGGSDFWIVKLDEFGDLEWEKNYGGSENDFASKVVQTNDGGFIVAGNSLSDDGDLSENFGLYDNWVLKLNNLGDIEWEKSYGGSDWEQTVTIEQTIDNGYVLVGSSSSNDGDISDNNGMSDFWIIKLDTFGELEWEKSFGGSKNDYANSAQQTSDGGYIIAGYTFSNDGDVSSNNGLSDFWLIKLNEAGSLEWEKSFGGSDFEQATSIYQTVDDGFIVAGNYSITDPPSGGLVTQRDIILLKLTNTGELEWQKLYGDENIDDARSIQQTEDGGYIIAGNSSPALNGILLDTDFWILKLDNVGEIEWEKKLGGTDLDYLNSIQQTTDNGYIVAGITESNDGDVTENNGNADFWIVKLEPYLVNAQQQLESNFKFIISPNPSNGEIVIQSHNLGSPSILKIYDMNGYCILSKNIINQFTRIDNIPRGQYSVIIKSAKEYIAHKLIVL